MKYKTDAGEPCPELDYVDECYRARAQVQALGHQAVLDALNAGYSVPQVALAAGCTRQAVYALVARLRASQDSQGLSPAD